MTWTQVQYIGCTFVSVHMARHISQLPLYANERASVMRCNALTQQIRIIVDQKNLGRWATLLQKWGFCRWIWDATLEFLRAQGYWQDDTTHDKFAELLKEVMDAHKWPHNPEAQMCRLYIKGKSLTVGSWMWRPIAAYPQPQIDHMHLRMHSLHFSAF